MIKREPEAPIYKKIQNYIFKFSDLLGQGNFSKVYRAHHEISSRGWDMQTKSWRSRSWSWSR
jgi:hypothetical protein